MADWVWDVFEKTMKMPVYTVAFAITDDYVMEASPAGNSSISVKVC